MCNELQIYRKRLIPEECHRLPERLRAGRGSGRAGRGSGKGADHPGSDECLPAPAEQPDHHYLPGQVRQAAESVG